MKHSESLCYHINGTISHIRFCLFQSCESNISECPSLSRKRIQRMRWEDCFRTSPTPFAEGSTTPARPSGLTGYLIIIFVHPFLSLESYFIVLLMSINHTTRYQKMTTFFNTLKTSHGYARKRQLSGKDDLWHFCSLNRKLSFALVNNFHQRRLYVTDIFKIRFLMQTTDGGCCAVPNIFKFSLIH